HPRPNSHISALEAGVGLEPRDQRRWSEVVLLRLIDRARHQPPGGPEDHDAADHELGAGMHGRNIEVVALSGAKDLHFPAKCRSLARLGATSFRSSCDV